MSKTREQRLQAAFLQFIADVADMRRKQKHQDKYPVIVLQQAQASIDKDLKNMGITDETDLKNLTEVNFK